MSLGLVSRATTHSPYIPPQYPIRSAANQAKSPDTAHHSWVLSKVVLEKPLAKPRPLNQSLACTYVCRASWVPTISLHRFMRFN